MGNDRTPGPGGRAPGERTILVRAIALLWTIGLAVRAGQFIGVMPILLRPRRLRSDCSPERLAEIVSLAATRCWPRPTCLTRALVLGRLLIACGWEAHVVVGVDRRRGEFAAHAWVECGGQVHGHDPCGAPHFSPVCRFARAGVVTSVTS